MPICPGPLAGSWKDTDDISIVTLEPPDTVNWGSAPSATGRGVGRTSRK